MFKVINTIVKLNKGSKRHSYPYLLPLMSLKIRNQNLKLNLYWQTSICILWSCKTERTNKKTVFLNKWFDKVDTLFRTLSHYENISGKTKFWQQNLNIQNDEEEQENKPWTNVNISLKKLYRLKYKSKKQNININEVRLLSNQGHEFLRIPEIKYSLCLLILSLGIISIHFW